MVRCWTGPAAAVNHLMLENRGPEPIWRVRLVMNKRPEFFLRFRFHREPPKEPRAEAGGGATQFDEVPEFRRVVMEAQLVQQCGQFVGPFRHSVARLA